MASVQPQPWLRELKQGKRSRYVFGLMALLIGCFGGSTLYLGRHITLGCVLAFLMPFYFVFLPAPYLYWLLLVLYAVSIIRAICVLIGAGYVGTYADEFIPLTEESAGTRSTLLACTALAAAAWFGAAVYLVVTII